MHIYGTADFGVETLYMKSNIAGRFLLDTHLGIANLGLSHEEQRHKAFLLDADLWESEFQIWDLLLYMKDKQRGRGVPVGWISTHEFGNVRSTEYLVDYSIKSVFLYSTLLDTSILFSMHGTMSSTEHKSIHSEPSLSS